MAATRKASNQATTSAKVASYNATHPLLSALHSEIQELAKKKHDATLNAQKVKMINRLLTDIQAILEGELQAKYLDLVNDEDLPQYSDVVLILSQYVAAMKAFHSKYYGYHGGTHQWLTEEVR